MNKFYVYAHYKLDGSVFYVGKGKGRRAWKNSGRSSLWKQTKKKHGLIVKIWINDLSEEKAFEIEKEWISLYGRKDLDTGCLVNLTYGGEGSSGAIDSKETRTKRSLSKLGRISNSKGRISPVLEKRYILIQKIKKSYTKNKLFGVKYEAQSGKFRARVTMNCKRIELGSYISAKEAHAAVLAAYSISQIELGD